MSSDYVFACMDLATRQLKAPSTAHFAPFQEWHIKQLGGTSYRLIGWVDAQNGFGAQIRQSFVATVSYTGKQRYRLDSIEFLDWYDSNTLAVVADLYEKYQADKAAAAEVEKLKAANKDKDIVYLKDVDTTTGPDYDPNVVQRYQQMARQAEIEEARSKPAADTSASNSLGSVDEFERNQQEFLQQAKEKQAVEEEAKFHKWTSANGKFSWDAKIISYANGTVTLVGRDGDEKRIQRAKLGADDQKFIDRWLAEKRRSH